MEASSLPSQTPPAGPLTPTPADEKKKSFWGGLLRRVSTPSTKPPRQPLREPRRISDPPPRRERRRSFTHEPLAGPSRRATAQPREQHHGQHEFQAAEPRQENEAPRSRKSRGKRPAVENGHRTPSPAPLTTWPPAGVPEHEDLTPRQATAWIVRGAPIFKGHKRAIPHMPERYYALYTTTSGNRDAGRDGADDHDSMTQLMSLRLQGKEKAQFAWETLEQPSYAFHYGYLGGTITLNQWMCVASALPPTMALRDSGIDPRPMDLHKIFERLRELRAGLEDDDPDLLYKILYRRILRDPDRILHPHKSLDKQITDLILVLSRPDWIDLSNPRNHVVTRYIFDNGQDGFEETYRKFFHQVLLSLELDMRIQSDQHGEWAKEKLLAQMPPVILWDLALARRWKENVRVEQAGRTPGEVQLRYKLKKRQVRLLKRFAQTMKWPNLHETLETLRRKDKEFALDDISSDAYAFFSGLVMPGPTFPFLIMNTLLDLDPDPATDELALLTHTHPNCGFQYRSSYTYWSASCIVGKVLAPTCHSLAGWVGPARPTPDLARSQIARIRTRKPRQRPRVEDIESMQERSEPLGPEAEVYPVQEFQLDRVDAEDIDIVRIETLGLRAAATAVGEGERLNGPRTFDATLQFAIDGTSWPLRLMYDVSFVSACPCSDGPHPLFFDYAYHKVFVEDILEIQDWGGVYRPNAAKRSIEDEEKVLAVQALGVQDNEVLARAWCAHWGLSAVVADVRRTCMSCAIREAYAATLTVVILIEGQTGEDDDDRVDN
ncbi:uncharacterized protein F5Z01DRAFT_698317 [Emericellopsis atlantica]|uniref:Uncharacterized protein n=1 Tax=Emericellopsis atlantica TaxID=2614577 RepID=A0A9P8CT24_9HYPO|nr:uncharacterized protein F5Z01DRAFT_698317 [Emericellopsis atlantica]KAG9256381.1 hypothetical protein F5Z01DRAFT_698317 [Emericellopsis atlantica]